MILEILTIIYEKRTFSSKLIAEEMGISIELVEEFKKRIQAMNLIKMEEKCEKDSCNKCSCGCSSKNLNSMVTWEITEKGMKLLRKNK